MVATEITFAGLLGAIVAWFLIAVAVPQGKLIVDLTAILVGGLVGIGIDRYLRS